MKRAFLQEFVSRYIWNFGLSSRQTLTQNQKALLEWFDGGNATDSGVRVNESSSLSFTAFWRCVNLTSQTQAQLPLHIFERTNEGSKIDYSHPASILLRERPNGKMTPYVFRETIERYKQVWGNGYAIIKRNNDAVPLELDLVHPQYVDIKLIDDEVYYEVNRPLLNGKMEYLIVPAMDMFHIKGPSLDGIKGLSIISYHKNTLGLGLGSQKFAERFFGHGAHFSGWIKYPGTLKQEQVERLQTSWSEKYRGMGKSWGTPLLENGAEFVPVSMPLKDAQFLESRNFTDLQVCQICGVPPHKIYNLERATFSNIEHQSLEYVNDTMTPITTNWEQEIKAKLFREDEKISRPGGRNKVYFVKYNYNSLLRGDSQARATFYNSALQNGWMNRDTVRNLEDMDGKIPGGDKYTVQLNMQELQNVGNENQTT